MARHSSLVGSEFKIPPLSESRWDVTLGATLGALCALSPAAARTGVAVAGCAIYKPTYGTGMSSGFAEAGITTSVAATGAVDAPIRSTSCWSGAIYLSPVG